MLRRTLLAAAAAALVVALPTAAEAKRPAAATSGWEIKLNETDPHLGGTVSFTVTYPRTVKSPRYAVRCYQGGVMTYAEARPADEALLLGGGGSVWLTNGGEADCTAELFWIDWSGPQQVFNTLAWTSFHAAG